MKKYKLYLLLIGIISIVACTEPIDINVSNQPVVPVVESLISNEAGPYYVRLSENIRRAVNPDTSVGDGDVDKVSKPIDDALVIISDKGFSVDTLEYIGEHPKPIDPNRVSNGWYKTSSKTKGIVGHTYSLRIEWKNMVVTAEETMLPVASIDSVTFRTKVLEAKGETVTIPLISFAEPQEEHNYYLLTYMIGESNRNGRVWPYSILDDKYLDSYVKELEVDDGQSPSGSDYYHNIGNKAAVEIYLYSLTPTAYLFYKHAINQFNADGGSFKPYPATPATNVKGGMGYFRVSALSKCRGKN